MCIMYFQFIISSVFINFVSASDLHNILSKDGKENNALMSFNGRTNATPYNLTYIDRAENLIRVPAMNKFEEKKGKRKTYKKTPKRTIQKIIKKNSRSKMKKLYAIRMTSRPTKIPNYDYENDQDDYLPGNAEVTTRPNQQKKMLKKYTVKQYKLPRNPMPLYRQMKTKKNNYKRPKREARDIFIFQDLDSMKFHKTKKDDEDYNVVDARFKNYW